MPTQQKSNLEGASDTNLSNKLLPPTWGYLSVADVEIARMLAD